MNVYKKLELLKAMKTILREYKNETHRTKKNMCSLCQLYINSEFDCDKCPMYIFDYPDGHTYPCMNRKCTPVDCDILFVQEDLEKVIKFYEASIKKVMSMTSKELNVKEAFKFLVDTDNEIDKKYNK